LRDAELVALQYHVEGCEKELKQLRLRLAIVIAVLLLHGGESVAAQVFL